MALLYVGSVRSYAGKNMVSLGLGHRMLQDGHRLAYMKPYGTTQIKVDQEYTDAGAWMVNQTLELGQKPGLCCPVLRDQDLVTQVLRGGGEDYMAKVRAAAQELAKDKDILLMSGSGTLRSGAMAGISGYSLVLELGAKALIVERYENDFFLDDLLSAAYRLGDNLAGVIINGLDSEMSAVLDEQIVPFLQKQGIPTLGRLAKDELLASLELAQLAERMGAQVLAGEQHLSRLVKRFFIGAMQVGNAQRFFGGTRDFACIVGGDRPDMQTAAIQGGAACLILTGNIYPSDLILSRAEEAQVAVLIVRGDTFSVSQTLEALREQGSLRGGEKTGRAIELVSRSVDFKALYQAVGM